MSIQMKPHLFTDRAVAAFVRLVEDVGYSCGGRDLSLIIVNRKRDEDSMRTSNFYGQNMKGRMHPNLTVNMSNMPSLLAVASDCSIRRRRGTSDWPTLITSLGPSSSNFIVHCYLKSNAKGNLRLTIIDIQQ